MHILYFNLIGLTGLSFVGAVIIIRQNLLE